MSAQGIIPAAEILRRVRAMLAGKHASGPLLPAQRQRWLLGDVSRPKSKAADESGVPAHELIVRRGA